jgi:hypothetical protein
MSNSLGSAWWSLADFFAAMLALLAFLTLGVSDASEPTRRLRVDLSEDRPPPRNLQKLSGFLRMAKSHILHHPVTDKLYEKYKQVKDKVLPKTN